MVKLASLVLLLMCTAAFAAPTFNPAKETELTDEMKVAKELSELDFFRFYSHNARMDQILESYLVARSKQITQEEIHQAIGKYRQYILAEVDIDDEVHEPDTMDAYLSAHIRIEKAQIKLDLDAAWTQTILEAMDKIQYRGDDDIMDLVIKTEIGEELISKFRWLNIQQIRRPNPGCSLATSDKLLIDHMSKEFGFEELKTRQIIQQARQEKVNDDIMDLVIKTEIGKELISKFRLLNIQQIRRPNPGCSLATGDELLIGHMFKEFGFEELKTRQIIQRARRNMLEKVDGGLLGLDGYSDDVAMDSCIVILLQNQSRSNRDLEILLAVDEIRNKLNREKTTLDAEQLEAYDDDQKMSDLLESSKFFGVRGTVEEARWQNRFFLAIRYRKISALGDLMASGGSDSKDVVESTIENLASNSKDQVDIAMLETLLKYSGFDSPSISLGKALTKAENTSNIFVLKSLLKLEDATHPTKDELALLIENHPAVKEFRESVRISEPLIEDVPASAEHAKKCSEGDCSCSAKKCSEGDCSKVVIESTIENLACNSKDQVDIKVLESLFNHPGFGSPSIGLGRALTKAGETSNTLVLTSLLKLKCATPTEDELALLIKNHPAVKAFRESSNSKM